MASIEPLRRRRVCRAKTAARMRPPPRPKQAAIRPPGNAAVATLTALALVLALEGCGRRAHDGSALTPVERIRQSGRLIVLTRNAPTTYYQGREELEGFEYELARSFARFLGVDAEFKILDNTSEILEAINNNEGHIAAAGLTRTSEREAYYIFGPEYQMVEQQVVCRRGRRLPDNVAELAERSITIIANSSYEERLTELRQERPELTWATTHDMETEQIMEAVWEEEVDCTIADSNIVAINRRYYPELAVAFSISEKQPLSWVVAPEYVELQPLIYEWRRQRDIQWRIDQLLERYYGYAELFDYVDLRAFQRRIGQRLPNYQRYFDEAAAETGFSWTLLAAQAYQESHWEPTARSPTGVRGMMMLTRRTARQMGVLDRLDPRESVIGGARYLRRLYDRLPEETVEPDRTWLALAAYNVGYGHLMDARILARRQDLDPNLWRSLRQTLPLLSKRQYYKTVRYGYARGREPVRYVQRIRDFQDILERRQMVELGEGELLKE